MVLSEITKNVFMSHTFRYGDKTPRSFFGRLFGVLWILLGVIVITMFTATVTSALTHSSSPDYTNALEGQEVSNDMKLKIVKHNEGKVVRDV